MITLLVLTTGKLTASEESKIALCLYTKVGKYQIICKQNVKLIHRYISEKCILKKLSINPQNIFITRTENSSLYDECNEDSWKKNRA